MKEKLLNQAKREYSPARRAVFLACLAPVFLLLIPYTLAWLGGKLESWLGLPDIHAGYAGLAAGGLMITAGAIFAFWSIKAQFEIGRGTPVPLVATQKLVIQPPYSYCRNPMALGTILLYLGFAVVIGSPGAGLLVLLLSALLLFYIKRLEEREMALRFGEDYEEYRRRTPFLIPRIK